MVNREEVAYIVRRLFMILYLAWMTLSLSACGGEPDWRALYSEKLGQPVEQINTAVLNTDFQDDRGNLTRVGWARLANGEEVFLGLPAHGNPPAVVVERTVVLTGEEVRQRCRDAFSDQDVGGTGSTVPDQAVSNTVTVQPGFNRPTGEGVGVGPDPEIGYCEFAYLPGGWEFRVAQRQGIIKSETQTD